MYIDNLLVLLTDIYIQNCSTILMVQIRERTKFYNCCGCPCFSWRSLWLWFSYLGENQEVCKSVALSSLWFSNFLFLASEISDHSDEVMCFRLLNVKVYILWSKQLEPQNVVEYWMVVLLMKKPVTVMTVLHTSENTKKCVNQFNYQFHGSLIFFFFSKLQKCVHSD